VSLSGIRVIHVVAIAAVVLAAVAACTQPEQADDVVADSGALSLADSHWIVERLGAESGPSLASLTLGFTGSNHVDGHDGCNAFAGDVTLTGSSLRISDRLAGTMMACADPIEARARSYRVALLQARSYRLRGASLELVDQAGNVLVILAPVPQSLAGSNWEAISYNNGSQAVVSLIAGTTITAQFGADGRVTGNTGCNTYFAGYMITGDVIAIDAPGSTRRACMTPDGLMAQEARFLQSLASATRYRVSGNRLELRNSSGALLVLFGRAGGA
jgi:heat shock protein HslJ